MKLEKEKLYLIEELVKTDDSGLLAKIKILIDSRTILSEPQEAYYTGLKNAAIEIKEDIKGQKKLKNAKDWINEL
jgi:hypothetical protein